MAPGITATMAGRYQDMLRALFGARRAGVKLGLERMHRALEMLEHPERRIGRVVHIGGTNGKGSCAAFVSAVARARGLRVGLFTSPHLIHFAERFQIAGQPAKEAQILAAYERVEATLEQASAGAAHGLTFFEVITAMGMCLFAEAGLDLTIVEVGLGGRLDATNAIPADVSCVTGVALDHADYLGEDLASIAHEKAGIFKPGQRAVIGCSGEPEAMPVLVQRAREANLAALTVVSEPVAADLALGLGGAHQRANAAAALAIAEHLVALGVLPADQAGHARALASAVHPGRLERLGHAPSLLLDGAHNPQGARALAREMAACSRPRALVLGVSQDKDARELATILGQEAEHLVLTRADNPRSMDTPDLARAARATRADATVFVEADVARAIERARHLAGAEGTVVIAGSLFLVGQARRELLGIHAPLDAALSDPLDQAHEEMER